MDLTTIIFSGYILFMDNIRLADEDIADLADFYKLFGDPTRLKILFFLDEKEEASVNTIADALCMSQSAISQQLKVLRQNRLVRFRKDGKMAIYRLNDEHIHKILSLGMEHYSEMA